MSLFRPNPIAMILLAFLLSCGINQTAGGGGTETVNTFAVLSNGLPASGAIVRIIDGNAWLDSLKAGASAVIESTVADNNGLIKFHKHDNYNNINVQIDHVEQGAFLSGISRLRLDNDTLRLDKYASYSGSFTTAEPSITRLYLSGSAYQTTVDEKGTFNFSKVASGAYALIGVDKTSSSPTITTCGGTTLEAGATNIDTGLNAVSNRLLIDNFETDVGPTSLGPIFPNVPSWYSVSEAGNLSWDNSIRAWIWALYSAANPPPLSCQSYIAVTKAPGANAGTAMEFSAALDTNCTADPYTTAGISFRPFNKSGIDLSAMQSFSLKVHGNGTIWVRFESRVLDSTSKNASDYSFPIVLTSAWQYLQIPIDSLRILPALQSPGQFSWSTESKSVIDIEFEFSRFANPIGDTLHLYLDDIYLNGVGLDVLK